MIAFGFRCVFWLWITQMIACGQATDPEQALMLFEGKYDVSETFMRQEGTQCPDAQLVIQENTITAAIDGTSLELAFEQRWGNQVGELDRQASFVTSARIGTERVFTFFGSFEENRIQGDLTENRGGACLRYFSIAGTKQN